MQNQEIINDILHTAIEKKMYVDGDTVAMICSYLSEDTCKKICNELKKI